MKDINSVNRSWRYENDSLPQWKLDWWKTSFA